jgi:hypothetical protein
MMYSQAIKFFSKFAGKKKRYDDTGKKGKYTGAKV